MKRTIVIGDIHGGLKALVQVFDKANITTADKLVFLGDYVDGWSESASVIDSLLSLCKSYECIFLRGNHDEWCEEWLSTGKADHTWLMHGGDATVNSYATLPDVTKKEHLYFFKQMLYYYLDEQNRLFVHAGFTSNSGPAKEPNPSNLSWDRSLWEMAVSLNERTKRSSLFYPKKLKLFYEIYIGHTPTLYYDMDTPMQGANVWNIDTGAAFTGKLTVMDIDTKQFWQSDQVKLLYPGEEGRNKK